MDAVDVRILRATGILPFLYGARGPDALKPARIARRLNISLKTTKQRLRRLEDKGVIAGYQIYPNLHHLGLQWRSYFFRVPKERKEDLKPSLDSVEGVVAVFDFFGPDLCVDLYFRDEAELQRRLRLLSELLGGFLAVEWYENRMPPVAGALSNLDWRIVKALRMRARRSPEELARELGVTAKTIRRRLDRMVKEGSVDVVPLIDPTRMEGVFPFALLFRLYPERAQAAIRLIERAFDESYLSAWVPPSSEAGNFITMLVARSTGDLEAMRQRAAEIEGVESVEALLPADMRDYPGWIDEAIERKIQETARTHYSGG